MGAQKKRKEISCLVFELISYRVRLFSFVGGTVNAWHLDILGLKENMIVFVAFWTELKSVFWEGVYQKIPKVIY